MLNSCFLNERVDSLEKEIKQCDECGSEFYAGSSKMKGLCPECANVLYGYPKCDHIIDNKRCTICYWDGSKSEYIKNLEQ